MTYDDCNAISDLFADIAKGWGQIKALFLKGNLASPKTLNVHRIKNIKDSLLEKEVEAWNKLIVSQLNESSAIASR